MEDIPDIDLDSMKYKYSLIFGSVYTFSNDKTKLQLSQKSHFQSWGKQFSNNHPILLIALPTRHLLE